MKTLLWLLVIDLLFVASASTAILSAKSMMKQFAGTTQKATAVVKLFGKAMCFIVSCAIVLYASEIMTLASTR